MSNITLRDANQAEVKRAVLDLLTEIHRTAKRETSPPDLALDTTQLITEVNQYFHYLTLEELCSVLRNGVRGYYDKEGKVYALSISTFHRWILSYLDSADRATFVHQQKAKENKGCMQLTERAQKSPEEIRKDGINLAKSIFTAYANGLNTSQMFAVVYPILESEGKICCTNAQKNATMRAAEKHMRKFEKKEVLQHGNDLTQGNGLTAVITRAQRMLTKQYFDELIEKKEELTFKENGSTAN